jgi:cell division protein FtsZ
MIEIVEKETSGTVIKVVGVGGAGGNAVDHMIREGVQGVEFVCANTDAQALKRSLAATKIQLGGTGLGAGAKPEAGRAAALENRERIVEALEGAHMVFITAGMGGGTGTGAAPVIAEVARELGILTVAVVTKPFDFENRIRVADSGVEELSRHVDSLIVVLNDKLMEVYGEEASFVDCFRNADEVLRKAVGGIAEIINVPGLVNVDFQDVRTLMAEMGRAMMGSAEAAGLDRARIAAEQAANSPLLEGVELEGARGVLINITASRSQRFLRHRVRRKHGRPHPRHRAGHGSWYASCGATSATGHAGHQPYGHRQYGYRSELRRSGSACRDSSPGAPYRRSDECQRVRHLRHPGFPAEASRLS